MKKLLIPIIVLVLLGGGVGTWLFTKDSTSDSTVSGDTTNTSESNTEVTTKSSDRSSDACTLFAKSDLEQIWGVTFEEGKPGTTLNNPGHTDTSCKFEQIGQETVAGVSNAYSIEVTVQDYESAGGAKSAFDADRDSVTSFSKCPEQAVSETIVGDGTYFNVAACGELIQKTSSYIVVLKGNEIIDISATRLDGVDQPTNRSNLIKLAQTEL